MPVNYTLSTDDAEITRLLKQYQLWRSDIDAAWERAGIHEGMTVVDAGAGPGFASINLARLVGASGSVIAMEREAYYIEHLKRLAEKEGLSRIIEPRHLDLTGLQLEPASIDAAHLRYLLIHTGNPRRILEAISHGIKPGGSIILMEYSDYQDVSVAPESAIFKHIWQVTEQWVTEMGGDFTVGKRLPEILQQLGFKDIQAERIVKTGHPGSEEWGWINDFTEDHIQRLQTADRITPLAARQYLAMWQRYGDDPESIFSSWPTLILTARKKP